MLTFTLNEVLKLPHQLGHEAHIPHDLQALAFEWCYGTAYQVSLRDVVGASRASLRDVPRFVVILRRHSSFLLFTLA
jgi:hypothetical protein